MKTEINKAWKPIAIISLSINLIIILLTIVGANQLAYEQEINFECNNECEIDYFGGYWEEDVCYCVDNQYDIIERYEMI